MPRRPEDLGGPLLTELQHPFQQCLLFERVFHHYLSHTPSMTVVAPSASLEIRSIVPETSRVAESGSFAMT